MFEAGLIPAYGYDPVLAAYTSQGYAPQVAYGVPGSAYAALPQGAYAGSPETAYVDAGSVGYAPVKSYAATVPTGYYATPAPAAEQAGLGTLLLDAIAEALGAPPRPVAAVTTFVGSAGAPVPATVVAASAAPVAAPAANLALPASVADAGQVASQYAATALRPVRRAVAGARRKGSELWAGIRDPRKVHVTQVPSRYNPSPAAGNRDCGPASVVMALKLLGIGVVGASPQRQIDRARQLAGVLARTVSTTNLDLERSLRRAGATALELTDVASLHTAIMAGHPVILNGNPRNPGAYGHRFDASQMTPYNGAHWVVVSGYDRRTRQYIVNDPLSKVGPVKVSRAQLEAYRNGSMGIEVSR